MNLVRRLHPLHGLFPPRIGCRVAGSALGGGGGGGNGREAGFDNHDATPDPVSAVTSL